MYNVYNALNCLHHLSIFIRLWKYVFTCMQPWMYSVYVRYKTEYRQKKFFLLHNFVKVVIIIYIITYLHIFAYELAANSDVSISFHASI